MPNDGIPATKREGLLLHSGDPNRDIRRRRKPSNWCFTSAGIYVSDLQYIQYGNMTPLIWQWANVRGRGYSYGEVMAAYSYDVLITHA